MNFWPMFIIRFAILFFGFSLSSKIFGFNFLVNSPLPETEIGKFWFNLFIELLVCYVFASLWAFKILIDIETQNKQIKKLKSELLDFDYKESSDKCNETMNLLSEKLKEWKPK